MRSLLHIAPIALLVVLAGCSGKKADDSTSTADSGPTTGTSADLVLTGPTIASAGDNVPLTRMLELTTARPVRVEATLTSGAESRTWRFAASDTTHSIPVIGFKAGRNWEVTVALVEPDGTRHELPDALTVEAPNVPAVYPSYDVRSIDPAGVQPGFTLLNLRSRASSPVPDETWTLLDERYEPVWQVLMGPQAKLVFQRSDGHFMGLEKTGGIQGQLAVARDLTGATLDEWHTDESWNGTGKHVAGTFAFHHDLIELPNGNFAALAKEANGFPVDNFPVSYDDPLDRQDGLNVNADRIIEFDPAGNVISDLAIGPLMDTNRIAYDSLDASFLDGRIDWIHANGLDHDPVDDAWIVSFRHQDAVIKIDRASGTLDWIVGTHTNWSPTHTDKLLTPVGATTWPYHQHSPDLHPDGDRLIVFDNGNWRASPWDGTPDPDDGPLEMTSRLVEYAIDEAAGTVEQTWEFIPPDGVHSCPAVGGAQYLDNGNVLATFGLVVAVNGTLSADLGFGDEAIRLVEFTPGDPHTVVADVFIAGEGTQIPEGWQAFKAFRIDSPYPPGFLLDE